MGDDFHNRQVYVQGKRQAEVADCVRNHLIALGYEPIDHEESSERSIAIGFFQDWVTVLDSGEFEEFDDYHRLTNVLCSIWPMVFVSMSDSAALSLSLYRDGKLIDEYQNLAPPFFAFKTEEDATRVQGQPELWSEVFPVEPQQLRTTWRQGLGSNADGILAKTSELFGWHPLLSKVGYTIDYDGCRVLFLEHYDDEIEQLQDVQLFHFRQRNQN